MEVVKEQQQEIAALKNPLPAYSRVVNLCARVPVGIGQEALTYTAVLGNRFWLLGVDLWLMNIASPITGEVYVYVRVGQGVPLSVSQLRFDWDSPIPCFGGLANALEAYGGPVHYRWKMKRMYEGSNWRLALGIHNFSEEESWRVYAGFEISEG